MTADEPMSTPDSGGLREAVNLLAERISVALRGEGVAGHPCEMIAVSEAQQIVEEEADAVLAAHPEPVPTPDSERAVEAAARAIHNKQEYTTCWDDADAGSLSRMGTPRRALGEQGREFYRGLARVALGAVPTPDSADDATVGERCKCGQMTLSTTVSERHDRGLHDVDRCIGGLTAWDNLLHPGTPPKEDGSGA